MKHLPHPKGVNLPNIILAAELIEKIQQRRFSMICFREGQEKKPKCNSVGCIVGHSTVLAPELLQFEWNDDINFVAFSEDFFGLEVGSNDWMYLFAASWRHTDNTPKGSAKRLRYYAVNGLPKNWVDQMFRKSPLIYNTTKS